ncbi:MAG: serine/threonine-protein phosphatase [Bacteroidetes bacterium]|nr:MAG: serine/threonine-protein phosphatase [Bacteroidota bacterium]
MFFRIEAISDRGKVRANNEDHVFVAREVFTEGSRSVDIHLENSIVAAIADGMGGHKAGEIASRLVLESLMLFAKTIDPDVLLERFQQKLNVWLNEIHHKLLAKGEADFSLKGMGTTLTGLFVGSKGAYVFNAGDSRTYVFQNQELKKITRDHTVGEASGFPHVRSNMLVNCIGAIRKPNIDVFDVTGYLKTGSIFLLCSDGLTDMLSENEIKEYLIKNDTRALVEEANRKGGRDNISVITLRLEA